ncbi:MAG TPA: hypothetical protein VFY16_09350 [Gemmatimonadaceae bacterium]|nr:hypothetical protein [Gemmatimonadaceae bacterium]
MSFVRRLLIAAVCVVPFTACYHATIDAGRPASDKVIDQPWAMSFVFGLVPPPTVETATQCPNGLAKVETEQSFLNGLVASLTVGIVTPMHIKVSCASGAAAARMNATGSARDAVARAAEMAVSEGEAVVLQF